MKRVIFLLLLILILVSCARLHPPVSPFQWEDTHQNLQELRVEIDTLTTEIVKLEQEQQIAQKKQQRLQSLLDELGAENE
ncbi:MAG: hypothetical protein K8S56_07080 [Candidatus Cloacimonetes bacterium]|nr:hypothetical protein [Candidatus Cloacimonadota bacterium]